MRRKPARRPSTRPSFGASIPTEGVPPATTPTDQKSAEWARALHPSRLKRIRPPASRTLARAARTTDPPASRTLVRAARTTDRAAWTIGRVARTREPAAPMIGRATQVFGPATRRGGPGSPGTPFLAGWTSACGRGDRRRARAQTRDRARWRTCSRVPAGGNTPRSRRWPEVRRFAVRPTVGAPRPPP